jgi:hypothetical protein
MLIITAAEIIMEISLRQIIILSPKILCEFLYPAQKTAGNNKSVVFQSDFVNPITDKSK